MKPSGQFRYGEKNRERDRRNKKPVSSGSSGKNSHLRNRRFRKRVHGAKRTGTVTGAQNKLKQFKQASMVAIAATGFLLLLFTPEVDSYSFQEDYDTTTMADTVSEEVSSEEFTRAARDEAVKTARNLRESFWANLPKVAVAIATLLLAWLFIRVIKFALRRVLKKWKDTHAIITLTSIVLWLIAIGVAVSVVAGDIRALAGSLGLAGLALSWSLQTPIESFTGWLQNSFQRYYRVGDRISVGEVFGDVYKIDFLTTTVWEIGTPYRQGFVQAEQPTGRLVTFPNNEILAGTVVNLTRDFPYVWDELAVPVANESDIALAVKVIDKTATHLLQDYMKEPAQKYREILKRAHLDYRIADKPEVYISANESWTDITVRYLVKARERRLWKSDLTMAIARALNQEEYKGTIIGVYQRQQVQLIDPDGRPVHHSFATPPE